MDDTAFSEQRALEILSRLAQGAHPASGEVLPADSVVREAEVVRALQLARMALGEYLRRAVRRAHAPRNVGAPWTAEEERLMLAAFEAGHSAREIAATLERTLTAIEARLEKLGRLTPGARATRRHYAARVPTQPEN